MGGQFWSVYVPGEEKSGWARMQLEQLELARRMIARYPNDLALALTADDAEKAFRSGKIASFLGMEGGHVLENSLGALRAYYALGARYMTLTHNVTLDWADSATDPPIRRGGLTRFGVEVVREMNRLGMLVDLSHAAPETMAAALGASEAPVIFSHSSARALCNVPRNVPDEILAKLPENGGVVMVAFVTGFVSQDAANILLPAFTEYNRRVKEIPDAAGREKVYKEIFGSLRLPKAPRSLRWPITSNTSERSPASTTWGSAPTSTGTTRGPRASRTSRRTRISSRSSSAAAGATRIS